MYVMFPQTGTIVFILHRRGPGCLTLCLTLTLGCTLQLSFLSQPITGFPSSPGQGRFVSSPQPDSAKESFYFSAFTPFPCALSSSFPLFSLHLFISLRSFIFTFTFISYLTEIIFKLGVYIPTGPKDFPGGT